MKTAITTNDNVKNLRREYVRQTTLYAKTIEWQVANDEHNFSCCVELFVYLLLHDGTSLVNRSATINIIQNRFVK